MRSLRAEDADGAREAGTALIWLLVTLIGAALAVAVALRIRVGRATPVTARPTTTTTTTTTTTATTTATTAPAPTVDRVEAEAAAQRERERKLQEAERSVEIKLYGEGWCPSCRKARGWLDANGIAYSYRDTSDGANKQAMRTLNPASTIPTITIEGQVIVGFQPRAMQAAIRQAAESRLGAVTTVAP